MFRDYGYARLSAMLKQQKGPEFFTGSVDTIFSKETFL